MTNRSVAGTRRSCSSWAGLLWWLSQCTKSWGSPAGVRQSLTGRRDPSLPKARWLAASCSAAAGDSAACVRVSYEEEDGGIDKSRIVPISVSADSFRSYDCARAGHRDVRCRAGQLCIWVARRRRRESALSGRNLDCRHVQLQGGHRCFLSVVCHCWQGGLIVVAGEEGSWSWKQETTRKVNNTSQQEETRGRYKNMAAAQQQWHVTRGWNIICHSEQQTPLKS
jgi:hypothetical protein